MVLMPSIHSINSLWTPPPAVSTMIVAMRAFGHMHRAPWGAGRTWARFGGFTLIELMVVIGVIAILLALLFPALHAARNQANCVACQSNLHQIGIAMQIYGNHNDGWVYPP